MAISRQTLAPADRSRAETRSLIYEAADIAERACERGPVEYGIAAMQQHLLAVLGFFLVFYYPITPVLELVAWCKTRIPLHRLSDTINNLALMSLMVVCNVVFGGLAAALYDFTYEHARLFTMDSGRASTWLLGYLLYEFIHYWNHRLGHRVNLLWADHSQHHSSEEMNFSVAGRLPPLGFFWQCWFFLPMALLGFSTGVYAAAVFIAIPYQYWLHTRVLTRRLGWLEYVINTPSNHRVHHAMNERYIDKNLGASLMVFDHLFGTYQAELDDEPCIYGQRHPLRTWNPLLAVWKPYAELFHDAWRTRSLWDKCRLWFMPTGFRPADVANADPAWDPVRFAKYPERATPPVRRYVVAQFVTYAALFFAGVASYASLDPIQRGAWILLLLGSLGAIGALLDDHRHARRIEAARLVVAVLLAWVLPSGWMLAIALASTGSLVLLASLGVRGGTSEG